MLLIELEQLERLCSEDTPHRLMITHTIDQFILLTSSYLIPSQNKVKAKKLEKLVKNWNFRNFVINLTHDTPSNGIDYLWQIWK